MSKVCGYLWVLWLLPKQTAILKPMYAAEIGVYKLLPPENQQPYFFLNIHLHSLLYLNYHVLELDDQILFLPEVLNPLESV